MMFLVRTVVKYHHYGIWTHPGIHRSGFRLSHDRNLGSRISYDFSTWNWSALWLKTVPQVRKMIFLVCTVVKYHHTDMWTQPGTHRNGVRLSRGRIQTARVLMDCGLPNWSAWRRKIPLKTKKTTKFVNNFNKTIKIDIYPDRLPKIRGKLEVQVSQRVENDFGFFCKTRSPKI